MKTNVLIAALAASLLFATPALAQTYDQSGNQNIHCQAGCSGVSTTANQGTPNAGGTASWWERLVDNLGNAITSTLNGGKQSLDVNVSASALPASASTAALQTTGNSSLSTIATNTTNAGTPTLAAGSAIVGKVGVDQTTPGTTNGVSLAQVGATTISTGTGAQGAGTPRVTVATDNATVAGSSSLPAGTNLIGKAGIDQTTNGTTNNVTMDGAADSVAATGTGASAGVIPNYPIATVGSAVVDVIISGLTATSVTPSASFDGGGSYATVNCSNQSGGGASPTTSLTANGTYQCMTGDHFELTQVGSGAVTVKTLNKRSGSPAQNGISVAGASSSGTADNGGKPVKVGAKYNSSSQNFSTGNATDAQSSENGALVVQPFAVGAVQWNASVSLSDTTNTALHASCGAGLKNHVTYFYATGIATTTAVAVKLNDNTSAILTANMLAGGAAVGGPLGDVPFNGTAATAINAQLSGSPTGAVQVNAAGFCAP